MEAEILFTPNRIDSTGLSIVASRAGYHHDQYAAKIGQTPVNFVSLAWFCRNPCYYAEMTIKVQSYMELLYTFLRLNFFTLQSEIIK